jgi:hypothetical protein
LLLKFEDISWLAVACTVRPRASSWRVYGLYQRMANNSYELGMLTFMKDSSSFAF